MIAPPTTARLSTLDVAMLPTHDPLVGRIVGSMLYSQELLNKPKVAVLEGSLNGSHPIQLTYQQADDGTVSADGFVGSVEIHEKLTPSSLSGTNGGKLFGVAGDDVVQNEAAVSGTVGGEPEKATIFVGRSSDDIQMTDDLRQKGRSQGGWTEKTAMQSTFGGIGVDVNVVPARYPTETSPICTREEVNVYGHVGDVQMAREFKWNTTTWNVAYSNRQTWNVNELFMVEDGAETQTFTAGAETTRTVEPTVFTVSNGRVEARSKLVTENGGAAQAYDVTRSYVAVPEKAAVKVSEQFGQVPLEFVIYTPDKTGA